MNPREMTWFAEYCSDRYRDHTCSFDKKFHRRFRMTYLKFWKLVDLVKTKENGYFDQWLVSETNFFGKENSPI